MQKGKHGFNLVNVLVALFLISFLVPFGRMVSEPGVFKGINSMAMVDPHVKQPLDEQTFKKQIEKSIGKCDSTEVGTECYKEPEIIPPATKLNLKPVAPAPQVESEMSATALSNQQMSMFNMMLAGLTISYEVVDWFNNTEMAKNIRSDAMMIELLAEKGEEVGVSASNRVGATIATGTDMVLEALTFGKAGYYDIISTLNKGLIFDSGTDLRNSMLNDLEPESEVMSAFGLVEEDLAFELPEDMKGFSLLLTKKVDEVVEEESGFSILSDLDAVQLHQPTPMVEEANNQGFEQLMAPSLEMEQEMIMLGSQREAGVGGEMEVGAEIELQVEPELEVVEEIVSEINQFEGVEDNQLMTDWRAIAELSSQFNVAYPFTTREYQWTSEIAQEIYDISHFSQTDEDKVEIKPKVLVVTYAADDETTEYPGEWESEVWQLAEERTKTIIEVIKEATYGAVEYQVVGTYQDVNIDHEFYENQNRYFYNYDSVIHQTVEIDGVSDQVLGHYRAGRIDEVWMWGSDDAGFWEYIYWRADDDRNYYYRPMVMGFNYERGTREDFHDFGHRAEDLLKHYDDDFSKWSGNIENYGNVGMDLNTIQNGGKIGELLYQIYLETGWVPKAGFGNVHFPPNTIRHYESDSKVMVDIPGYGVNDCSLWGCDHLGFLSWWFQQMPYQWYEYVFGYNHVNTEMLDQ